MCEVSRSYNVCIERLEEIFRLEVESLVICEVLYEVSPLVTELKRKSLRCATDICKPQ